MFRRRGARITRVRFSSFPGTPVIGKKRAPPEGKGPHGALPALFGRSSQMPHDSASDAHTPGAANPPMCMWSKLMPAIFHFIRTFHDRASVSEQMRKRGSAGFQPLATHLCHCLCRRAPGRTKRDEKACAGFAADAGKARAGSPRSPMCSNSRRNTRRR